MSPQISQDTQVVFGRHTWGPKRSNLSPAPRHVVFRNSTDLTRHVLGGVPTSHVGPPVLICLVVYLYTVNHGWYMDIYIYRIYIWLMMVNNYLVGGWATNPSEKWWSESQLGWFSIPNWMESHKTYVPKAPTSHPFIDCDFPLPSSYWVPPWL